MYNKIKSAAITCLLIISGTGIYIYGGKTTSNVGNQSKLSTNDNSKSKVSEQSASFSPAIILRKKTANAGTEPTPLAHINMPKSLNNTDASSLIHVDDDNQLILDHDIKVLFDYFFSSEGDLSPAELVASMQQYINQAYPQPAAQQALDLLDKYLDYKQQMRIFHAQNSELQDLPELNTLTDSDTLETVEMLMQARQDMREQVFTLEETDAFFAQENSYDQYMLTVAKLDSDLSAQERKQQIELISQQHLTEAQRLAREQTFILQNSPPNFSIDDNGDCQGNIEAFSQQQVTALCSLARKRLARSKSDS